MKKESKWLVLEKGATFSRTKLVEFLNEKFKKKSGSPFTMADVNKYVERGHLPAYLGANSLTEVNSDQIGVRLVKLGDAVSLDLINRRITKQ